MGDLSTEENFVMKYILLYISAARAFKATLQRAKVGRNVKLKFLL
jgi:hypothetical protein